MPKYHLIILRSSEKYLDINSYNCQELGLAKTLSRYDIKVSIIMVGKKKSQHVIIKASDQKAQDIHIYYLPVIKPKLPNLSYFKGFKHLFLKLSPDILQINDFSFYMSWYAARLSKQINCKVVLCQGTYELNRTKWKALLENKFNHLLGKEVLQTAQTIGYKSYRAKNFLSNYGAENLHFTPIGLDETQLISQQNKNYREHLNLQNKKILLYIGVLTPRRNPLFLISLLKYLPKEYVLFIVGSGQLSEKAKQYAQHINVHERCFFFGNVPKNEIASFYASADIFLLASSYEIYGMAVLEALYSGLPIIATRTAGTEVILQNQKIGILTNSINQKEWVKHIMKLGSDPNLPMLKQECHTYIKENFLWDITVKKFLQLYESH